MVIVTNITYKHFVWSSSFAIKRLNFLCMCSQCQHQINWHSYNLNPYHSSKAETACQCHGIKHQIKYGFWEREGFAGLGMWSVLVVQSEQHVIYRLMAGGEKGGQSLPGRNWRRETAVSGSSQQLTLKKGAPGDQVWDLLCMQLASYLERGPLMWMMPLHLHVNQKSDYDMIWCLMPFHIYAYNGVWLWYMPLPVKWQEQSYCSCTCIHAIVKW